MSIECLCDENKQGSVIVGYNVVSVEEAVKICSDNPDIKIVIGTYGMNYMMEIKRNISNRFPSYISIDYSYYFYDIFHRLDYLERKTMFLDKHVMDHEKGSWFHQLDAGNNVLTTVWPGKPDVYHAFQAMLIPYNRIDISIASAIREA